MMTDSQEAYGKAGKKALLNARQLLDLAEHSLKHGGSGHAYSLAIMAHEETAKAYVSWTVSLGVIEPEDDLVKAVYSDHLVKNWVMLSYHLNAAFWEEARMGLRDPDEELKAMLETSWENIKQFEEGINEKLKKEAIAVELRRREGFYVNVIDYENYKVTTPQTFEHERAENALATVWEAYNAINALVMYSKQNEEFRIFFTELLNKGLEDDQIEE
jgi:AbiV family abortive infection protein